MANPKLIKVLWKGSNAWNCWREQHPNIPIDLSEADLTTTENATGEVTNWIDLRGADLSGANLRGANLNRANLSKADLRWTNLSGADLSQTNLSGANLRGAILSNVDLSKADLSGADLNRANLNRTNLNHAKLNNAFLSRASLRGAILSNVNLLGADLLRANLREANLSHSDVAQTNWEMAIVGNTKFVDLDIRTVIGLKTVRHSGPSSIGIDTIYRSHGQIPEVFLRGAGVPETFITNMRALVASMSPIDYYTCFISYSHHNEDFAKHLHADLQARGVRCWFAEEDLKIGDHYHQRIDEAIRLYDKLIIVLSETAVESTWVEREVVAAREKEERQGHGVLFPIRLDEAVMQTSQAWAADVRRRWHIGDFTQWKDHDHYQQAFERLMHDLKAQK